MKLSISVSTNKSGFWHRLCESLSHNVIDMEVILVGPCAERPELPVPVKFISSNAGAALCWEIGARAGTGDILGFMADDCIFTPGYLDKVAMYARDHHDPHDMFTGKYVHNGRDQFAGQRFLSVQGMPDLPVGGFSYMETHRRIGGVDRHFNGVLWDTDLYMDLYSRGGRCTVIDGCTCHEVNPNSNLFVANHGHDWGLIASLWPASPRPDMKRLRPREGYTDDEAGSAAHGR